MDAYLLLSFLSFLSFSSLKKKRDEASSTFSHHPVLSTAEWKAAYLDQDRFNDKNDINDRKGRKSCISCTSCYFFNKICKIDIILMASLTLRYMERRRSALLC